MMRVARVSVLIASALVAQGPSIDLPPLDYSLGADSQPHAGVPAGAVTKHVLPPGKFFPGTPHNYQVYVPAQYDPKVPAKVMVFQDGVRFYASNTGQFRVPIVLSPGTYTFSILEDERTVRTRPFTVGSSTTRVRLGE